ncbi:DUF4380 domain-containing protein [Cytophagaceae bacterium ABcell3]|nr:DUF4380 domain-containing protein [Cytophagaceae bacterium ABcell3]
MKINNLCSMLLIGGFFVACNGQQEEASNKAVEEDLPEEINYSLRMHNQSLDLDPEVGGRIASLTINGKNFLTGPEINEDNWGSTFWPAPQSAWGWPPSEQIDKDPYTFEKDGDVLRLTSKKDEQQGILLTKEFEASEADTSFIINYTMTNESGEDLSVAPWEISRVAPGGLTFYPTGEGEKRGDLVPLMKDTLGVTWFEYDVEKIPTGVPKLLADGSEGWMAQVNGNYILVKKFKDISPEETAPEEGEIEIYANPDRTYIEIEQQGAYETLAPDASTTWTVRWYLRELPDHISGESSNQALLDFVRNIVE